MSFLDRFRKSEAPKPLPEDSPLSPPSPVSPSATEPEVPVLSDLDRLLDTMGQIDTIIGPESPESSSRDIVLRVGFDEIRSLIPSAAGLEMNAHVPIDATPISIMIPNGLEQLARGKVTLPLKDFIRSLPSGVVRVSETAQLDQPVVFPLPMVVRAVPPEDLKRHGMRPTRETGLEDVPDPFGRQAASTPAPEPTPQPSSSPSPPVAASIVPSVVEPVASPAPAPSSPLVAPASPSVSAPSLPLVPSPTASSAPEPTAPPLAASVSVAEAVPCIRVRGVDLNRADVRALVRALPGVGPVLAQRLVAARPFRTVFDLAALPGVGRRQFERMTGELPLPAGPVGTVVEQVLDSPGRPLPPLQEVARRIAALPGIHGCLLSHLEGHILAAARANRKHRNMGAIAPQIVKMMDKYLDVLKIEPANCLTLYLHPRPVHMVRRDNIVLTVSLERSRISLRRIRVLDNLTGELVRRLHAEPAAKSPSD